MDREVARALVDAGYMPLARYVEQMPSRVHRPAANWFAQVVHAEEVMAAIEARLREEGVEYER